MRKQQGGCIQALRAGDIFLVSFVKLFKGNRAWPHTPDQSLRLSILALISILVGGGVTGCTTTVRRPLPPPEPRHPSISATPSQVVVASWYGPGFQGQRTASGERFQAQELTAAHRSLPLGSQVMVTNLATGKSVRVRINDRGPYVRGRSIDLSRAAARRVGLEKRGVGRVRITVASRRGAKSWTTAQRASPARIARRRRPAQAPPATTRPALGSVLSIFWPF
jgi:rare lipoprotein A